MTVIDEALPPARKLGLQFEGLRLKPYLCPAGIPTIGVGNTTYEDGRKVTLQDPPITTERAAQLHNHSLAKIYLPATLGLCPSLRGDALAAIGDFAYNLGATRLAASTLRRKLNARDWCGARRELLKWVRGGGKVLPGLVARRQVEATMLPEGAK